MTKFDKNWLFEVARLVKDGCFTEVDLELQKASIDYCNLANRLEELGDKLSTTENLQPIIEELENTLFEVDARAGVEELCDAIRGFQQIGDVPEYRRKTVWACGDMWFRSVEARAVLERAKKVIARIVLQESILPTSCPRDLDEVRIKFRGEIWEIHQNDADPLPSNPHAHMGRSTKLDLRNGDLYNKALFLNDWIKKKDLEELRTLFEKKGVRMPDLAYEKSKRFG
jgi:hypothetical protein